MERSIKEFKRVFSEDLKELSLHLMNNCLTCSHEKKVFDRYQTPPLQPVRLQSSPGDIMLVLIVGPFRSTVYKLSLL